ncbi:hypothetical protein FUA26_01470 [Seonamhaeicola algicola]|uniref:Thioredoxin domain-containing protein n=1 Tax=Seonamhaeicola algicola TaxID=1719036 RepID=A0A5C7BBC3_9FLAO|nr:hypothetical protein [Seonamhaeicola algicola]TXE15202.1 hypothetical protein FUA26_01470 [Seonamhaeicola algicola]
MKFYLCSILSLLVVFGCKNNSEKAKENYAYFGGEVINPNARFVTLTDSEHHTDTIKLDGRNRFLYKIDNLKKGVYTFKHGGEFQTVLLEPEDSVLVRLNTLEFDESLVFTGNGAKKNNYFINEFLENEYIEKHILRLCQLEPEAFEKSIDSIRNAKLKKLEPYTKKCSASKLFKKIAKANIDFQYYSSKEAYPFMHYGQDKGAFLKSLPNDFYSYRKDINYNDTFFKSYHNYLRFLKHNINTLTLEKYTSYPDYKSFNWNILRYNLDKLEIIDSLVSNPEIKNELLYHFTMKFISFNNNQDKTDSVVNSFLEKTTNEKAKIALTNYTKSLKNLEIGSSLPAIEVLDFNNTEHNISNLINNTPTVVSFWSHIYYNHFKKSYAKIKELKMKYPEVNFITINIDEIDVEKPKQTFKTSKFSCSNQYVFKNPEASKKTLAIYPMTKTIIVNKNQKVVSANANIFSINFEEQLLGVINQ